jgi:hypothetical protein
MNVSDGRLFPDHDLIDFASEMYGSVMGNRVEDIFSDDPDNVNGFSRSIRRSLSNELDNAIQNGIYRPGGHDGT